MGVSKLKYLAILTGPLAVFLSLYLGGYYSLIALLYVFGLIPLLELILPASEENMTKTEEAVVKQDRFYDFLLYAIVPIQYALLYYFLNRIDDPGLSGFEVTGMTFAFGISCGVLGINVAHELGHRRTRFERVLAKTLLLTSLYMHFIIEHNRGHHKNVSTDEDPASARYGEVLYFFWIRSVLNGYVSAWKLENNLVRKKGQAILSLHNEMVRFTLIQLAFLSLIFIFFGTFVLLCFVAAAVIGFLLLETVNYIEHYGLTRKKIGRGHYEKVLPAHSWNSNHTMGRILLFELTRHSDHHYLASRKYQVLRHFEDSPQMPTGYPGMMVLSFFPPIWFSVMHRQIRKYQHTASD